MGNKYLVELNDGDTIRIDNYNIDRLMTPEEAQDFEMRKAASKYNL